MNSHNVHHVRFYEPKPKAIYCMAFNAKLQKLALSRSDASIEIWNLEHTPNVEKCIPSSVDNYSIEGLAWGFNRLFSVGLHALLIEYDLSELAIRLRTSTTGQTAFCLDVHEGNAQIAVGTEQGYLNLFSITETDLVFDKFLDKQEGRILCLKYDASGRFIASGSLDAIRVWDVTTGHAIHKMSTGRAEANKETIVWCLAITKDLTIISGDSRGKLSFWDGKVGVQIERYQSHRADVLSLCLSEDERTLFCAGIDANIVSYERVAVKDDCYKWVKSIQRRVHDHDVRALVLHGQRLYSGGVDGYLACSYHPPKTVVKYPQVMANACVQVAHEARMLLLRFPKHLEVWTLDEPKKLLVLQRQAKTHLGRSREGIASSAISSDGRRIAYSTNSAFRLFEFKSGDGERTSCKPELIPCNLPEYEPCINAIFTPNCKLLIVAPRTGNLHVLDVRHSDAILLQIIETSEHVRDCITFLLCSPCGQFMVAGDPGGHVALWKLGHNTNLAAGKEPFSFYCKLPKYACNPTAISIQAETMNLVIAYSDHKIFEYNLLRRQFSDFSKEMLQTGKLQLQPAKHFPIRNITFDPRNSNVIVLHDDTNIYIVHKDKRVAESASKWAKIGEDGNKGARSLPVMRTLRKYRHLVHFSWLSGDEVIAVETKPLALLERLPPAFKQPTFGTK